MHNLKYRCPDCMRLLAPVPVYRHAASLSRRTCRGCRMTWNVKVTPTVILKGRGVVSQAEFIRLGEIPAPLPNGAPGPERLAKMFRLNSQGGR